MSETWENHIRVSSPFQEGCPPTGPSQQAMQAILEKLRLLCPDLPPGVSPEELTDFEEALGRRLPGALRLLYKDHNGESLGPSIYRLLPLHDAYALSEDVWCFWEQRYDPSGAGANYHFADGSVRSDLETHPSVQAFLQSIIEYPMLTHERPAPPLPEAFALAERMNCSEREIALLKAIAQAPLESAARLLPYLCDDEPAIVIATCEWMALHRVAAAIDTLASLSSAEVRPAARRALEALGAQIVDYEVREPVPAEFQPAISQWGDQTGASVTLLQRNQDSPWEAKCCRYSAVAPMQLPQAARTRPGMYFGSLDGQGTHQLVVEIIANAVDQFLQGHATHICVHHDEWTLQVEDDGHGYPLDSHLGEAYLTHYHNSPTADHHAPHIHLVTQGLGLAPVNAVCSEFQIEARGHRQTYHRGQLVAKETSELTRGTRVRLQLDRDIWPSGFQTGPLRRRLFDFVHLIPGLPITLNHERFHAPRGLLDLAQFDSARFSAKNLHYQGQTDFLTLQFAATGESKRHIHIESWVNGARTEGHGSHVDGALEALQEAGWRPARVLVHVILQHPEYAGPVRGSLRVPKALRQIRELLRRELPPPQSDE